MKGIGLTFAILGIVLALVGGVFLSPMIFPFDDSPDGVYITYQGTPEALQGEYGCTPEGIELLWYVPTNLIEECYIVEIPFDEFDRCVCLID